MPIIKNCQTCGNQFKVPPVRENAKYCSHPCSVKTGSENTRFTKKQLLCFVCNKLFEIKPSQIKRSKNNHCSRQCSAKTNGKEVTKRSLEKRVIKKCIVCGKEKTVKPSHAKIEGTYCSKDCMAKDYKTRLQKENNPNFSHGKSHISNYYFGKRKFADGSYDKEYPKKLYDLQRGKCASCYKKLNGKYDVDHIFPIAKGGTNYPENIQLLCKSCNCKKHAKDPFVWAKENGRLL
jgi:hypothetical protein